MLRGGIPCPDHPIEILTDNGVIRRLDDRYQLQRVLLGGALCFLSLQAGTAEPELTRKRESDIDLRVRKPVRRIIIGHELADQLATYLDRNKGDRTNALANEDR